MNPGRRRQNAVADPLSRRAAAELMEQRLFLSAASIPQPSFALPSLSSPAVANLYAFTTLDYPGATGTQPEDISGGTVVGSYFDTSGRKHGFLYANGSFTNLDVAGAKSTQALGISGSTVVGTYQSSDGLRHGFMYQSGIYTTIDDPDALGSGTMVAAISGSTIVGTYLASSSPYEQGFTYSNGVFTTLNYPTLPFATELNGISGGMIVGNFLNGPANFPEGFVYNGTSFTPLDFPGAEYTAAQGISGSTIVGSYADTAGKLHGFSDNSGAFSSFDDPSAQTGTAAFGADGSMIVGSFDDANNVFDDNNNNHGFIANAAASALPPTATLSAPSIVTTGGASGTITVTYSDGYARISRSSITPGNLSLSGPNGPVTVTGVNVSPNFDSQVLTATYTVAAPGGQWSLAVDAGTYAATIGSGQVTDALGNTVASVSSNLNVEIAPTGAVDITQPIPMLGSPTLQFSVTYSDAQEIDTSSLGGNNLAVTDPNGNLLPVSLASTNLADASSVTVIYEVPAPSGLLSPHDNGTYTVTSTSVAGASVESINHVPLAPVSLGTFQVSIAAVSHGPHLVAGVITAALPPSAIAGSAYRSGIRIPIVNVGDAVAKGKIVINVYASPDQNIRGNAELLVSFNENLNLLPSHGTTGTKGLKAVTLGGLGPQSRANVVLPPALFKWPTDLNGQYFLVAKVNATASIPDTSFADSVAISSSSVTITPGFVNIQNLWNGVIPSTFKKGRRLALPVLLQNIGNIVATGAGTVTVESSPSGSTADATALGTSLVRLNIPPKSKRVASVVLLVPALVPGKAHLLVTVSFPGDADITNDAVVSGGTFTI